jgi:hypothetical protein
LQRAKRIISGPSPTGSPIVIPIIGRESNISITSNDF